MKLGLIIALAVVVALVLIGVAIWGGKKRRRLEEEIRELDKERIAQVYEDALKRLKPSYPQLAAEDFNGTIAWKIRISLPSGPFFWTPFEEEGVTTTKASPPTGSWH